MSLEIISKKPVTINESITALNSRYDEARSWHARKLTRITDNWHFYWGLDPELGNGQWPADVVQAMLAQKRQLLTYNFAKVIVDTMAGGIMQSLFDPNFVPVSKKITPVTEALKKGMYSDKELMDWDAAFLEFVIGGLIGESAMKMVVSTEFDELGNIGFKPMIPGTFITDPGWKTRSTKDLRVCWQEGWFTPEELCEMFPEKTDLIRSSVYSPTTESDPKYGQNFGIIPWNSGDQEWGDRKKCISEYRLIEKRVKREFVLVDDEEIQIPEMEDIEKPAWLNANYPNWNPDMVYEKPTVEKVCTAEIACPSLTKLDNLYKGKASIQCGQVPFFVWAASMHNGERHSTMDTIKDACRNINYWESTVGYKLQVEGGGGAKIIDPAGWKDNEEYLRVCNSYNDPTKMFETKPGLLIEGKGMPVRPLIESQIRSDIWNRIDHIIQVILPQISKVTPSMAGRQENDKISGVLYKMMKIQGDQAVFTTHFGLKVCFADIYDAYFNQAITLYSNKDIERTFTFSGGKESITLNEEVDLPNGKKGIKNRVADLKEIRHKTIITESQQSPTDKMNNLSVMTEYLNSLGPIATFKPGTIGVVTNKIAQNIEQFNEEDRDELKKVGALESELQIVNLELAISNAKLQKTQVDMQLKQAQGVQNPVVTPGAPPNPQLGAGSQQALPPPESAPEAISPTTSNKEPQAPEAITPNGATSPKGEMV